MRFCFSGEKMPAQSSSPGTRYCSSSWPFVLGFIQSQQVWNPLSSGTLSFPGFRWRCLKCYIFTLTVFATVRFHSFETHVLLFPPCASRMVGTQHCDLSCNGFWKKKKKNSPQVLVLVQCCQILDGHNPWSSAEKRLWVASVMRCGCRYQELWALMRPAAALRNSTRLTASSPPAA